MIVVAIVFGVIGTLLGAIAILFAAINTNNLMNLKNTPPPAPMILPPTPSNDGVTEEYERGYKDSHTYSVSMIQLSIFDMFMKNEIIDYEAQIEELTGRMDKLQSDEEYRNNVIKELTLYLGDDADDANNF